MTGVQTCALPILATQFNGWLYDISVNNIYQRGPLYLLSPLLTLVLLGVAFVLPLVQKNRLSKNILVPFLFFPIPALAGIVLQAFIYGFDFSLKGLVISIFFYFTFVLSHQTTVDYLTGAYNRKGLDDYLKKLAHNAKRGTSFTAIMLDLDNFKCINDKYGHNVGDEALVKTVAIIKESLDPHNFVARYGGDEFFIVLETGDLQKIKSVIEHLNQRFIKFNHGQESSYQLTCAVGYKTFDLDRSEEHTV